MKYLHPKYNPEIGDFQGLYETIGFIVVRGDDQEIFLNYGFNKEKSKVLYSTYRKKSRIAFSHLYFFLPSITDTSESFNQYLKKVNINPLDVKQEQLNAWADNVLFKPNKLGFHGVDTKIMSDAVVKSLRRIAAVSNSNLIRNADSLLCQKDIGDDVEWVGGVTRATPEKFNVSY